MEEIRRSAHLLKDVNGYVLRRRSQSVIFYLKAESNSHQKGSWLDLKCIHREGCSGISGKVLTKGGIGNDFVYL